MGVGSAAQASSGDLDTAFNNNLTTALAPNGLDGPVWSVAVDSANRVVVGGAFSNRPGIGSGAKRVFRVDGASGVAPVFTSAASASATVDMVTDPFEVTTTGDPVAAISTKLPAQGKKVVNVRNALPVQRQRMTS